MEQQAATTGTPASAPSPAPLSAERLAEIETRLTAVEPFDCYAWEFHQNERGGWAERVMPEGGPRLSIISANCYYAPIPELGAHAPRDLRDLLVEITRLQAENTRLAEAAWKYEELCK